MSTLNQFFGGGSIKSIQRGVITIPTNGTGTGSATITAVDTSKSVLHLLGFGGYTVVDGSGTNLLSYLVLTNSTTITAAGGYSTTNGYPAQISWQIVEYY